MRALSFNTCSLLAVISLLACGQSPATTTSLYEDQLAKRLGK